MTVPSRSTTQEHAAVREGIVTGLIGAAIVALFFLGIDLIRGAPLLTPSVLGEVFVLRRPSAVTTSVDLSAAALYTVAHLIAFAAFGLLVVGLAHKSETSSLVRYAVFPVFLAFIVFFQGVLAVADEATRGLFPIWSVLAANILAAAGIAWYVWRRHPGLRSAFRGVPLGVPEPTGE
jgi:hypothetical protein